MEKPIKKRRLKNKKARPKPRPKNRYMRGSKLSEYKFLQILKGFAYALSPKNAAAETGISEKTVRSIYAALRHKVMEAAKSGKPIFGLGSDYLYKDGELTEKGASFLDAVARSQHFKNYLSDHAPRLGAHDEQEYVFDLGMRIFTGLVVADEEFYSVSEGLQRSLILLAAMQSWIDANKDEPGFVEQNKETIERHASLSRLASMVEEQRQIIALRKSSEHRYAADRYYQDLRKHLLKSPIGVEVDEFADLLKKATQHIIESKIA